MTTQEDRWLTVSGWTLRENRFDARWQGKCESVMHLSNGSLGVRAALEEEYPFQTRGAFVAGVFDGAPGEPRELANVADMMSLETEIDGQRFSMQEGKLLSYARTLDMRTGELLRQARWLAPDGRAYQFAFHRFLSEADRDVIGQRVEITPLDGGASIRLRTGVNGRMSNAGTQHFSDGVKRVLDGRFMLLAQTTLDEKYRVIHGCVCRVAGDAHHRGEYAITRRALEHTLYAEVARGETLCFEKLGMVTKSDAPDEESGIRDMADRLRALSDCGYDAALGAHLACMRRFWAEREIRIEATDPMLRVAMRYAQYQMRGFVPVEKGVSIGAKGLSGEGFKGHVFWDVESFLLPYYLYHQPDVAKRLLRYRVDRLDQAAHNARLHGRLGVMFPWESADTGYDETPALGQIDIATGRANPLPFGLTEYHITADIALAAWRYWRATGDDDFLREGGARLIVGAALFWAGFAVWNERMNRYELPDVVGPDEYSEGVDNNAYTNYMAHAVMGCACRLLEDASAEARAALEDAFGQPGLLERLRRVRGALYLPKPSDSGVIPQSDGFLSYPSIDLAPYRDKQVRQSIFKRYSHAQINRMQVLKQADVVMLFSVFPRLFDENTQRVNWTYYEKRTLHDASLSRAIYALTARRLGMEREADDCLWHAMRFDIGDNPYSSNDGIHAAALSGIWMNVVLGFCGVSLDGDMPEIDPALPEGVRRIELSFYWRGEKVFMTLTHERLTLRREGGKPLTVRVRGAEVRVGEGAEVSLTERGR